MMCSKLIIAATTFALTISGTAVAQGMGPGQGYGPGWGGGPGMMQGYGPGWGGGPGMMQGWGPGQGQGPGGYGMGPGMMQGYGGGWGMHPGMMQGYGPGWGGGMMGGTIDRNLSVADVKANLERWLAWRGNPRLKLGDVKEADKDTITASIVTKQENAVVDKLQVDRHTGWMQRVD